MNDKNWDGGARTFRTLGINGTFVANGGTFVIKTDLANNTGDTINITGNVSGNAKVQVAYDPFFDTATDGAEQTGEHTFFTATDGAITITAKAVP